MTAEPFKRVVVLASADADIRYKLRGKLTEMRWHVKEANGGAEAIAQLEEQQAEALLLDDWLPDLEANAFAETVRALYPKLDLLRLDGTWMQSGHRSLWRNELLHAIRDDVHSQAHRTELFVPTEEGGVNERSPVRDIGHKQPRTESQETSNEMWAATGSFVTLPGMIGQSAPMAELTRLVKLVAPHSARVLIEGETGTGKELVAKALHTLSGRANKAFVVLNCAAIPEALLEAELFGHVRGAFTGAVQNRIGRIEAAHGGTLFLDEIGEMPISLQAKLLRFLENGELQRVGDNETVRVSVRVVSATHRSLEERVEAGAFRLDLLHRLSVFPIPVPSLLERMEDLPLLAEYFLAELGKEAPRKRLAPDAIDKLFTHTWPGNVRELGHVLQRAAILAEGRPDIRAGEVLLRRSVRA